MEMFRCFFLALFGGLAFVIQLQLLQVNGQDQSGFISLDCGLPQDSNYTEITTGLNYSSDASFIETGISRSILPEFRTNVQRQMWYVRSFPEGIRNCYNFRLKNGSNYLIRASFMYGNYDSQDKAPEFDMHLGPNLWFSVRLKNASTFITREIVHVVSSDNLYVCLVNTGNGTPFISVLELRLLMNSIYKTQTGSLDLLARLDIGSKDNETIRYKDDVYDRIWWPQNFAGWNQLTTSHTIDSNGHNDFQPPSVVMRTAATPKNASQPIDILLNGDNSTAQFYVYMHFAEVKKLQDNEYRQFNISLNGKFWFGPFVPDYLYTTTIYTLSALTGGQHQFSIYKAHNSSLPPILNALEVYMVKELLQTQSDPMDVEAITNIKSMYGLKKNWQGDPCAPQAYLWDGLNCSYAGSDPPRIISLNLSSSGLTGEISRYISNLNMIEILDLSENNLTGPIPEFLSQMTSLRVLSLRGNLLNGSVPVELIERSKNGSLSLSVEGNQNLCLSASCKKKKKFIVPVVASAAAFLVLVIALTTVLSIKIRKKQARKADATSNTEDQLLESKNRQFTYSEVLKITNNFERVLGKGGFGTVYHGYLDGAQVAVKMLSSMSVEGYKRFQAEVESLLRIHHRNLTSIVGYYDEGTNKGLIYEYMANGNLEQHLSESSPNILSWEQRLKIAMEAAQGLEYLHDGCTPPIIHRDVKSTNILLSEDLQAKLADFGLSRTFPLEDDTTVSTFVAGTPGYLDPEYSISNRLTEKSDVYSFGVVLLEIITSRPVIKKTNKNAHISQWVSSTLSKGDVKNVVDTKLQGDFDIDSVSKTIELALSCVSPISTGRPTMNHVVMELGESLAIEMERTNNSHKIEVG
ncbi:LRR receptor-like serine/threonine-protein kinase IOS1 [Durio zibethinus]|uniref:non-specific serine/threonine protein kinase n=1 Tax=Durio zibethinus TaxID=66656 RepID=A0A6P5WGK5_DURZI|nr:LRR receptor-like serine/threonine-protein kinase IOS1 [Durio zibethinus]